MERAIDRWITGYHPGKWSVRGLDMHTLLFGHVTLMERMLCFPWFAVDDLVHCLMICSRPYKQAEEYANLWKVRADFIEDFRDYLEVVHADFEGWDRSMNRYMDAHLVRMEEYKEFCDNKGEIPGAPFFACMRVYLIKHMNYDPLTLDKAPYSRCLLDMQTCGEMEGRTKILEDRMLLAIEQIENIERRKNGETRHAGADRG